MAAGPTSYQTVRTEEMTPHHDLDTTTTPNSWKPKEGIQPTGTMVCNATSGNLESVMTSGPNVDTGVVCPPAGQSLSPKASTTNATTGVVTTCFDLVEDGGTVITADAWCHQSSPNAFKLQDCAGADRDPSIPVRVESIDEMAAGNRGYFMDIEGLGDGCIPANRTGCIDQTAYTINESGESFVSRAGAATWRKMHTNESFTQTSDSGATTVVRAGTGLPASPSAGRIQVAERLGVMTVLNNDPCRSAELRIEQHGRLRIDRSKAFNDNGVTQGATADLNFRINGGTYENGLSVFDGVYNLGNNTGAQHVNRPPVRIILPAGGAAVVDDELTYITNAQAGNDITFQILYNLPGYFATMELI